MGAIWATATTITNTTNDHHDVDDDTGHSCYATAGVDANIAFPDIIQGMANRNSNRCLVEGLGNRECLVYQDDQEKFLYKGADVQLLLGRLQTFATALQTIPPLVEIKKWSKITGFLTGPRGQLSAMLTVLVKMRDSNGDGAASSSSSKPKTAAAQKVRNDMSLPLERQRNVVGKT